MKQILTLMISISMIFLFLVGCNNKKAENPEENSLETNSTISENNSSELTDKEILEQFENLFGGEEIILPDDPVLD